MNIFYTYAYLRKDGSPCYIGKGCNKRAYVKEHGSVYPPKNSTQIIFLHENCTEEQALAFEIFWIAVYGRKDISTGILRNKTNGGDNGGGRIVSAITRKNMSISAKRRGPNQTGRKRTHEQRKNIMKGVSEEGLLRRLEGASKGGKWHTGKPKPKYKCLHCEIMVAANMLNRYHNNNCKLKDS